MRAILAAFCVPAFRSRTVEQKFVQASKAGDILLAAQAVGIKWRSTAARDAQNHNAIRFAPCGIGSNRSDVLIISFSRLSLPSRRFCLLNFLCLFPFSLGLGYCICNLTVDC